MKRATDKQYIEEIKSLVVDIRMVLYPMTKSQKIEKIVLWTVMQKTIWAWIRGEEFRTQSEPDMTGYYEKVSASKHKDGK